MGTHLTKNINIWKAGQTLVEAIVALSVIMLVLAAIFTSISTSVNNSNFLKDQSVAGKHAQEGMENIRHLRNTDGATFESYTDPSLAYCMDDDNVLTSGGAKCDQVNVAGKFIRQVKFDQNSIDCGGGTLVSVSVFWSSSKCSEIDTFCHSSDLVSCFSSLAGSGSQL